MASICWVAQCRTVRGGNSLKGAEVTSNRIQSSTRTREWRNKLHGAQPHYVDFSRKLRFWRTFKSKDDSALRAGYSSRFGLCLACMRMACCVQFKGWALPSSTWPWIPNLAPPPPPPPVCRNKWGSWGRSAVLGTRHHGWREGRRGQGSSPGWFQASGEYWNLWQGGFHHPSIAIGLCMWRKRRLTA